MIDPPTRGASGRFCAPLAGLLLILCSLPAAGQIVFDAVPGGVIEIPLVPADQPRPRATFGQERVLVRKFAGEWVGLVGLPLDLVPGKYIIQAWPEGENEALVREFTVFPRRSRRQSVVELPETPPDAGGVELAWRDGLDAAFPLATPVDRPARPLFGRYRRVSVDRTEQVDFVAFDITADTPVVAPGAGRVAASRQASAGTFVWIDHGMGLYSCIGPLRRLVARVDEAVKTGRDIGRIGPGEDEASRALYWSLFLNGTAVNPFQLSALERARE